MYIEDIGVTITVANSTIICQFVGQHAHALAKTGFRCHELQIIAAVIRRNRIKVSSIFREVSATGNAEALILL